MTVGTHGTTFGGNPLAMAIGNAVLDVVLAPGFIERGRAGSACCCASASPSSRTRIPRSSRRSAARG